MMKAILWAIVALACSLVVEPVRAEAWDWEGGAQPSYIKVCKTNHAKDRTRDRICSDLIQSSYGDSKLPEAALFLRERLSQLIGNYEESAHLAYNWYLRLVLTTLILALVGAAATWWRGASARSLAAIAALGIVLVTALGAFGFNVQFKAHFTAARKLSVERDALDLALIEAAAVKGPVADEIVKAATGEYRKIIAEHSNAFGGALSPPTAALFFSQ